MAQTNTRVTSHLLRVRDTGKRQPCPLLKVSSDCSLISCLPCSSKPPDWWRNLFVCGCVTDVPSCWLETTLSLQGPPSDPCYVASTSPNAGAGCASTAPHPLDLSEGLTWLGQSTQHSAPFDQLKAFRLRTLITSAKCLHLSHIVQSYHASDVPS